MRCWAWALAIHDWGPDRLRCWPFGPPVSLVPLVMPMVRVPWVILSVGVAGDAAAEGVADDATGVAVFADAYVRVWLGMVSLVLMAL